MGVLPHLHDLRLFYNQIGDSGLTSFATALGSGALPRIEKCWLHMNPGNRSPVDEALAARKYDVRYEYR